MHKPSVAMHNSSENADTTENNRRRITDSFYRIRRGGGTVGGHLFFRQ
ncbi:MAG TPA: hypothetical protein VK797_08895 [Tepidisphaeraceae bacterium]|nr:hypothetical protein [Tepidisphaeraceae bacterium]